MNAIAQRGQQFLIQLDTNHGQIWDEKRQKLYPPQSIDAILARGYWLEPTRQPEVE